MGRMLGAFDNADELDRPDLNKCPDCGCFFAGDYCPVCGKLCPEEMRAGNRKAVKKKKEKYNPNSRVTFVEWYHSWWFIIIMMFVFPIVGIILLATSPHKKWQKITFAAVGVAYLVFSQVGIYLVTDIISAFNQPVDTSISKEEYMERCEEHTPEELYRSASAYKDKYVTTSLKVKAKLTDWYEEKYYTFYICEDENGGEFELLIRDCVIDGQVNLIPGDLVTVYGEGAGEQTVYATDESVHTAPCINVAYIIFKK